MAIVGAIAFVAGCAAVGTIIAKIDIYFINRKYKEDDDDDNSN